MKTHRFAEAVPGRSAAGRRNALTSAGENCRKPERYRYLAHPVTPKSEPLTAGQSVCAGVAIASWGCIALAPAWWYCDTLPVMGWTAVAAVVISVSVYMVPRLPAMIGRMLRKRRKKKTKNIPVRLVKAARGRNTYCGYVSREVICAAAKAGAK